MNMSKSKKLKNSDFLSIFWRSFFIQAVWNFKSLLSLGFCFCFIPVARRLFNSENEMRDFLLRHLSFFNAHPYFASYALGALARIEEESVNSETDSSEKIEKFKNALMGPLGAIGDQYFWSTIKPGALLFGFTGLVYFENLTIRLMFLSAAFLLYNVPHFYTRITGLRRGYRYGYSIYKHLNIENFLTIKLIYKILGASALGLFIGYVLSQNVPENLFAAVIFAVSGAGAYYLRTHKKMIYLPILIPLIGSTVIGILVTLL